MEGMIRSFLLKNPNFNHEKSVVDVTAHSTYWLFFLVCTLISAAKFTSGTAT
jgi:hypothetical protein